MNFLLYASFLFFVSPLRLSAKKECTCRETEEMRSQSLEQQNAPLEEQNAPLEEQIAPLNPKSEEARDIAKRILYLLDEAAGGKPRCLRSLIYIRREELTTQVTMVVCKPSSINDRIEQGDEIRSALRRSKNLDRTCKFINAIKNPAGKRQAFNSPNMICELCKVAAINGKTKEDYKISGHFCRPGPKFK